MASANAGGSGLIPDWETKIPYAMSQGQKIKKIFFKEMK